VLREGARAVPPGPLVLPARGGIRTPVECGAAPIRPAAGEPLGVVLTFRDVAERTRLEEQLRQRARELAEADRRKDEFLAMLGHELRNPLAPIRHAAEVLRLADPPGPRERWAGEVIDRQVAHLARLVDDLLDVSRITRGKVRLKTDAVELAEVLERAVELSRPLIQARRHELVESLPPAPVWLEADPARLAQVVANLLNNAAKYTDERGRIVLSAAREGGEAVVRVRDTGVGIPAEMLPRVFDLFAQADRTLDRAQGGLGIGLTLVRRLVEMHGGTVEAHTEGPGKGSEFVVRLPALAGPPRGRPSGGGEIVAAATSRRVLVVDDNADSAEGLAVLLRLRGYEVRTAGDGESALAEAAAFRPGVVLLDLGLPGPDGYEVARRLRREPSAAGAVLVALTGYGQEEDRRHSREAGFDHHLVKPADLVEVEAVLAHPRAATR
jgi:signal transduction histidine kinase/CheY-like chemotaxis protein